MTSGTASVIRFANVEVVVPVAGGSRTILAPLDLTLTERRIAVIGGNGSGKSTLLRLLNGLIVPSAGSVTVDGLDTVADGRDVRRRVGFVFTDPLSQLVMPTPVEDVELSLRRTVKDRRARTERALALLTERGLGQVARSSVYDLSGGERQLVALTSVLAVEPAVLVADEPTTLLDLRNRELVRSALAALPQRVVLATHDLDLALDADRVLVVDQGRVVADGEPAAAVTAYRRLVAQTPSTP
ncbi:MAG TPA: ABC transporter ATP-binding protein [Propionibacteriaceae bacterium]|nr:ABC transporter ATP-binding protein [Propionibacteriaceae bacterium]